MVGLQRVGQNYGSSTPLSGLLNVTEILAICSYKDDCHNEYEEDICPLIHNANTNEYS